MPSSSVIRLNELFTGQFLIYVSNMILQGSSNITLTLFNLFLKNTPTHGHQGPPHLLFSTCWHNLSRTAKWPLSHLPTPSECTAGGRRGCLVCLHFKHLLPPHRRGAWLVERKKARGRGSERVSTSPHGWLISPAIRRKKEMEKGLFHCFCHSVISPVSLLLSLAVNSGRARNRPRCEDGQEHRNNTAVHLPIRKFNLSYNRWGDDGEELLVM